MAERHVSPTRVLHQCKHCGVGFYPKRTDRLTYCSRECAQKAIRPPGKPVTRFPFSKVHFPKCAICSRTFTARHGLKRYCGEQCYLVSQSDRSFDARECAECGTEFVPVYGLKLRTFCSDECGIKHSRRVGKAKRKARQRGVTAQPVNPLVVFNRDAWRCQLCGCSTPRRLRGTLVDRAPELDHIIPLAAGGEHSYLNTQCACRVCNIAKGAKPLGQMRLIA